MNRALICAALMLVLTVGCGKKADPLNPPDAPVIPPSTRSRENPGLPPQPGQPQPGTPTAPAR